MKAMILIPLLALAACNTVTEPAIVDGPPPWPQDVAVGIGQSVFVTPTMAATPVRVVEDSRCPANARCAWQGRLVLETRIDGAGWAEGAMMTLGEPVLVRGTWITLVAATPAPLAGQAITPSAYRFTFGS